MTRRHLGLGRGGSRSLHLQDAPVLCIAALRCIGVMRIFRRIGVVKFMRRVGVMTMMRRGNLGGVGGVGNQTQPAASVTHARDVRSAPGGRVVACAAPVEGDPPAIDLWRRTFCAREEPCT